jgi:hypothetical protein
MRKLYGDSIRKDAGFVKVIKNVASKNVRLLESRAGRHAPELKRVAKEVKGTFDKVYEETAEVVEEFLSKCEALLSQSPRCQGRLWEYFSEAEIVGSHAGHQNSSPAVARETDYHVRLVCLLSLAA